MTAPGRREAAQLLLSLSPSARLVRHSCAVADVAGWLARRAGANGHSVDAALAETAALLHDADKALAKGDPVRRHRHGEASAAWLVAAGHPDLGAVVAMHPVSRLADGGDADALFAASLETKIVAYADKRASQALQPMARRFATWERRYPDMPGEAWPRIRERADALEREVCAAAGVRPEDVRRHRWSRRALAAAAAKATP